MEEDGWSGSITADAHVRKHQTCEASGLVPVIFRYEELNKPLGWRVKRPQDHQNKSSLTSTQLALPQDEVDEGEPSQSTK